MTGIIASIYGFLGSESDIPVPGVRRVVQIKKTHLNIVKLWVHGELWICPYISRHLLSLNPLLACCRRYSR
ncbi:hypothetical protein AB2876_24765, partial [Escherichia coli]